jgi:hypothetical protein
MSPTESKRKLKLRNSTKKELKSGTRTMLRQALLLVKPTHSLLTQSMNTDKVLTLNSYLL